MAGVVVDTSVWIDYLNDRRDTVEVLKLDSLTKAERLPDSRLFRGV